MGTPLPAPPVPVPLDEDAENHLPAGPAAPARVVSRPATTAGGRVLWAYAAPVLAFHLLLPLIFVPWLFTWTGLLLVPLGNYVFCSLGIGAGFHRLLTHRSYRCPAWVEHTLALLGVCSLQGSPARWCTVHRMHHQHSDNDHDPHSPAAGWFWGHMGWVFVQDKRFNTLAVYDRYARDLLRDRFYFRLERHLRWLWVWAAHAALFPLAGLGVGLATSGGDWLEGLRWALSLTVWGVIARTVYTWHVTWGVNSAAHLWGYRNYETDESSRNNWVIALATNGDGWHNNHHADPRSAAHGFHRWWELDVTYLSIRALKLVGLASDVVTPRRRPGRAGWVRGE